MKVLTREGWTGLVVLIINLVGMILGMVLPGEWTDAIPLILAVLDAIGALIIWIVGRQTAKALARLEGR